MLTHFYRIMLMSALVIVVSGLSCASKKSEPVKTQKAETLTSIKLADLPLPVRTTIEKLTTGGEIKKIEKDTEDTKPIYVIEARVNNKNLTYDIAIDGSVLISEESIPYSSLPELVRSVAEKYFGTKGEFKASKEVEDNKNFYEVEGKKDGIKVTLKLSEAGQIVEEEKGE